MRYKDFYINQLSNLPEGTEATIAGWVEDMRDLGKIKFLKIKERNRGTKQIETSTTTRN